MANIKGSRKLSFAFLIVVAAFGPFPMVVYSAKPEALMVIAGMYTAYLGLLGVVARFLFNAINDERKIETTKGE